MRIRVLTALCVLLAGCQAQPIDTASVPQDAPKSLIVEDRAPDPAHPERPLGGSTYSNEELVRAADAFFGGASEGIALAVERIVSDFGRPAAYIVGQEGGGAAVVGLRYGHGTLQYKGGGSMKVYWQGPSVGWDFGGSASKVFTLVYNLRNTYELFQRFPAVDGSLYFIAGVSVNYQRSADIVLAPIRSGVGLRAGASLGYVHYTREPSLVPF